LEIILLNDTVVVALLGIVGSVIAFFLGKPKQHAEVTGSIVSAAETSVEMLLKVMDELKLSMNEIKEANDLLKLEIDNLIEENINLQKEIADVKEQNIKLLAENVKLRKEIHKINTNLSK
jgi:FtsZ-binding cell division protein ZapB